MKKLTSFIVLMFFFLFITGIEVHADAAPGDVIVTLGKDLTNEQKNHLMSEMKVPENVEPIYVTNEEEHRYLGKYISKQQIGTRAISSSKITLLESSSGILVKTNNVKWVSETMYANALVTAGVKDAEIYVTAPFEVSGTAALTGIIKAYEITYDIEIPEEQKQIANEELVRTAELGDRFGHEKAAELITRIKEELAENPVETDQHLRSLIERVASDLGLTLTEDELNGLFSLFKRMQELNIDWNQVQDQIIKVRDNLEELLSREDTQNFLTAILDFLVEIVEAIKGWFSN